VFSSESIWIFLATPKHPTDANEDLLTLLGFLTSTVAQELIWVFGRYRKIENRAVSGLPISLERLSPVRQKLAALARDGVGLCWRLASLDETTVLFDAPDAVIDRDLSGRSRTSIAAALSAVYGEIDACVEALLGMADKDLKVERRAALVASFAMKRIARSEEERAADAVMWGLGCAFGRWRQGPRCPEDASRPGDVFASFPRMAPSAQCDGTAAREILVDDEGHGADVEAAILSALASATDVAFGETVSSVLSPAGLRQWARKGLFQHHLLRYSDFKRKAPIYWQLATPSAQYSIWLYAPALTQDTLFKVQNEYLAPKLNLEERRLELLRRDTGDLPKAGQRTALARQESLIEELRTFHEEVRRVAALWKPDLDDGILLNFAPLWRLIPHHKTWQKELMATWDALVAGDHDWAHLAMHLWPERVVPKCAVDRSLAIAHGLEKIFWLEGTDGKWKARATPSKSIDELVNERSSPAVKAALASLLDAPATLGNGRTGGRRALTNARSR
jgi:hypothetical protein